MPDERTDLPDRMAIDDGARIHCSKLISRTYTQEIEATEKTKRRRWREKEKEDEAKTEKEKEKRNVQKERG